MKKSLIDPNFVAEIQAGKHVFGTPDSYIKEKIKKLDKEIALRETVKAGEFYMQDKELRAQMSILKAKRIALENAGDYFLSLINKCDQEPWRNSILFCNIAFNYNPPKDDENKEESIILGNSGSFINSTELSSLMGAHVSEDEEDSGKETIYDFAFQTRFGTYLININTAKTSDKLPLFVMDNTVSTPIAPLFDLTTKYPGFTLSHNLYEVIFNKTGALIFKNENWKKADARLIHIKDFKKELEKEAKEPMINIERYKHLDFLYKHFVRKEESQFSKEVNKNLKRGG